jgi:hypothetical protein
MISFLAFAVLFPEPAHFLAVDGLVLGSLQNHFWRKMETAEPRSGAIKFTKVGIGKTLAGYIASGIVKGEPNPVGYVEGVGSDTPDGVLFSGRVTIPRKVTILSNQNSAYLAVTRKFLLDHGVNSAPRITKVVKADLDGNGTDEVIIEASNRDDLINGGMHGSKAGDYSLVLLRYERHGKAFEHVLEFHRAKPENMNYLNRLLAVADFDGDGIMEIVVSSRYYEGASATLYRYRRSTVTTLLEMGDGV